MEYHPDRVAHLGQELKDLAAKKTTENQRGVYSHPSNPQTLKQSTNYERCSDGRN